MRWTQEGRVLRPRRQTTTRWRTDAGCDPSSSVLPGPLSLTGPFDLGKPICDERSAELGTASGRRVGHGGVARVEMTASRVERHRGVMPATIATQRGRGAVACVVLADGNRPRCV